MRLSNLYIRNIQVAYPWSLGDGLPEPPFGFQFLTDESGVYLTDDNGNFLVGNWNG